jgi:hypothetical protein
MTYDLLLAGDLDVPRLTTSLSLLMSVPLDAVDVAGQDVVDRNWDAAVLATYDAVLGDVSWSLNVYLSETVTQRPTEARAAEFLADALGIPVLYSAGSYPPSSYWLASSDGPPTRARVYDGQGTDGDRTVIDAVERPVASLPHVRVEAQPEVIRRHSLTTPVSDDFTSWLTTYSSEPDTPGDAIWNARTRLGAWENLTVRMASGWPPDGWYPADYYRNDLVTRDELAVTAAQLPTDVVAHFEEALEKIDNAFRAGTRETDPMRLTEVLGGGIQDPPPPGWWWGRLPAPVPWPARSPG